MLLSFTDVLVHFCCHKAPICHNAEQQKQYDKNSLMVLKNLLKMISVPPVTVVSLLLRHDNEWRNKCSWKILERPLSVVKWPNSLIKRLECTRKRIKISLKGEGPKNPNSQAFTSINTSLRDWAFPESKYWDHTPPSIILYIEKYKENTLLEFCKPNRYSSDWELSEYGRGAEGISFFTYSSPRKFWKINYFKLK